MKTPEYYWNLDWDIKYSAIADDDGGGFEASIPELGRYAFVGDGETKEEAFASLKSVFLHIAGKYIDAGDNFPIPKRKSKYSGKFLIRVTPNLHESLARQAEDAGVSLNQYVAECLAAASVERCTISKIDQHFATVNDALVKTAVFSVGIRIRALDQGPTPKVREAFDSSWGFK